jgi:hypothetical protein
MTGYEPINPITSFEKKYPSPIKRVVGRGKKGDER